MVGTDLTPYDCKSSWNSLPRNSFPLSLMHLFGRGYLQNHVWSRIFAVPLDVLFRISVTSNQPVAGSHIVSACKVCYYSSCLVRTEYMALSGQHKLCPKGFDQYLSMIQVSVFVTGIFTPLKLVSAFDMLFNIFAETWPYQMGTYCTFCSLNTWMLVPQYGTNLRLTS